MSNIDKILTSLTTLKPGELDKVAKRVALLRRVTSTTPAAAASGEADWLLDGIYAEMKRVGLGSTLVPYKMLSKVRAYETYKLHAPGMRKLIEDAVPNFSDVEVRALGMVIAKAYISYSHQRWESRELRVLLGRISSLADAIDASFPGYLQAGMLPVLLRQHQSTFLRSIP